MSNRGRIRERTILILAFAALYGCDRTADNVPEPQPEVAARQNPSAAQPVVRAIDAQAEDEMDRARRRGELEAEIAATQSQQAYLETEKLRIAALVQSHQSEGERRLVAMKEQFRTLQSRTGGGDAQALRMRDQFAERARNDLEQSLLLDQEYQAQLGDVTQKLSATDSRLRELRTDLQALQVP